MVVGATMPVSATLALEKHCYVSDSQEDLLDLCEGWEHRASKRCATAALDETPSQPFPNLTVVAATGWPPEAALLESDSDDSDDGTECNMGFTQEPVEWASPPSPQPSKEVVQSGDDGVNKDDSYIAAFESDRSQSPTHSCQTSHQQQVFHMQVSENSLSTQPLTQLPMEAQTCSDGTPPPLPLLPIAEISEQCSPATTTTTTASAIPRAPLMVSEQESLAILTKATLAAVTREGIITEGTTAPLPQVPQDEREGRQPTLSHEVVGMIKEINLRMEFEHSRWLTQEPASGVDNQSEQQHEECLHNQLLGAETAVTENLGNGTGIAENTEVSEHNVAHTRAISEHDVAHTRARGDHSCQVSLFFGEGIDREEIGPSFKRKSSCAVDVSSGQGIDASHTQVQKFPKTVMDVVRMHSVTDTVEEEETCGILSVAMRAGISFPLLLHEKKLL